MTELLTAAQMRAIERAAIESGAVTGLELMERAGRGTVEAILEEWPELAEGSRRAVVLCGPGNNGGDGFVVARLLRERGWAVEVFLYGRPVEEIERLPPDAATNARRWIQVGPLQVLPTDGLEDDGAALEALDRADVVVDALFGTGLGRGLEPIWPYLSLLHSTFDDGFWPSGVMTPPRVVAIDIPSGLCSDSGRVLSVADKQAEELAIPAAHLTVTFHREKVGHRLHDGPWLCTKLKVVNIGLDGAGASVKDGNAERRDRVHLAAAPRRADAEAPEIGKVAHFGLHKYHHGHALVLSGGPGRGGAARMAARGALRIGAGLVTLSCPPAALQENAARLDAVMTRPVKGPEGLAATLSDERLNALALGPGLGGGEGTRALVGTALRARRATVLDADALTAFEGDPAALFALLHDRCVLTPHGGEFARLFPDLSERLAAPAETGPAYSKVDATREAAARAGCVVLHKGPDTVIAAPDGRAAINSAAYERSAPWLATAGAGDVLTGFIAGLLARGLAPMQAAEAAAWLHVECALAFGPGLIAEDLPEQLPKVFRRLGP